MKKRSSFVTGLLPLILSMVIFGTIGLFRRGLPLPSAFVAFTRGVCGSLFLLFLSLFRREKVAWRTIRTHWLPLFLSGALIGFNWIFLFEAYRYTTVATATLCYYMAPVFVILAAPFVLKEPLTWRKAACVAVALLGMVAVSGVFGEGGITASGGRGILFGVAAAVLYACVTLINKHLSGVGAFDRATAQLAVAGIVVLPYSLLTEDWGTFTFSGQTVVLLLTLGILHTGLAYALYFAAVERVSASGLSLFGYIDPITAVLLSAVFLSEPMDVPTVIGTVLILGAALFSEFPPKKT